jgi:putative nucleotidyltransferase with HDIG domain
MKLRPLPKEAQRICHILNAPEGLVEHLRIVHQTAGELLDGLERAFPALQVDRDAVLFGAAIHDIGKATNPFELVGLGRWHEEDGPALLTANGVPPALARFARTHGRWSEGQVEIEDLLVALADHLGQGARNDELEGLLVEKLAEMLDLEPWRVLVGFGDVMG